MPPTSTRRTTGRVLVIDDDPDMCEFLAAGLAARGFLVTWKNSAPAALDVLANTEIDAILTDLSMPGMDGLALCERIVGSHPDVPVLILTAAGSFESAVAAIRVGAYDFITKPPDMDALVLALGRAVAHNALRDEVRRLRRAVEHARGFGDLIGASPAMQKVYDLLERIADSDASVLITGESGTGKELVARALHQRGRRSSGPFVTLDCAAVPETLLESELFGHVRGAFTDARTDRTGLFVTATGGTLFLDEIGELPAAIQPKLLRALQQRTVRPVGSDVEVPCDVRIVAATNRDLEAATAAGRFRDDLYFRINVIHVALPALRARGNDVLLLAQSFVERFAAQAGKRLVGLAPATAKHLLVYSWPGNVRELQNVVERAVAFARYEQLTVDDLPDRVRGAPRSSGTPAPGEVELVSLEEVERAHILRVLDAVAGSRTAAARILGLDRKTLYRRLESWGKG